MRKMGWEKLTLFGEAPLVDLSSGTAAKRISMMPLCPTLFDPPFDRHGLFSYDWSSVRFGHVFCGDSRQSSGSWGMSWIGSGQEEWP
jgi:hypothetical protein